MTDQSAIRNPQSAIPKVDFLLEIGCEDLPDWTGRHFEEQWLPRFREALAGQRLACEDVRLYAAPRRLVLHCRQLDARQKDVVEEVTGPPVAAALDAQGNYTPAAIKFAEAHGVAVADLGRREKKGREVLAAVKKIKGVATEDVIGGIVTASLARVEVPRAMKWDGRGHQFVRPVRWVLALLGRKKVALTLYGAVSNNFTYGHRVLAPGKIRVASVEDYFDRLKSGHVLLDPAARRGRLADLIGKVLPPAATADEDGIREVSLSVEYPCVAAGVIAPRFAGLPGQVIGAVVRKLKAIPLYTGETRAVSDRFVMVFDGVDSPEIRANYEKVVEDKLEDARFFMDQDLKTPLAAYSERLRRIAYHPRWGTVHDRVERFVKMASFLTGEMDVSPDTSSALLRAAALCKNDLATQMVAEFASLQGVMGRIYAEKSGEPEAVCVAIEQHYRPRFSGDERPENQAASLLSVIDKTEMICGRLLDGAELSGSGDPYGLKRAMSGIIEIIWQGETPLPLKRLVGETLRLLDAGFPPAVEESVDRFIRQRADNLLAGEGIPAGLRRAVLAVEKEDLLTIRRKIDALKNFLSREDNHEIFVPFTRVANILKQAQEKGLAVGELAPDRLADETEQYLHRFCLEQKDVLKNHYQAGDYGAFLESLRLWRGPIDTFFDRVMVMCPEEDLRRNRLALLKCVNDLFGLFADFSCIEHCGENTVS